MHELVTIILASNLCSKMKSSATEVIQKICGKPLLSYVIDAASQAGSGALALVLDGEDHGIREIVPKNTIFVFQEQGCNIAHSLMQIADILENKEGTVLLINGNIPTITAETLRSSYDYHRQQGGKATILAAQSENLSENKTIPSGICFIDIHSFLTAITRQDHNSSENNIFPEIIQMLINSGTEFTSCKVGDPSELRTVQDRMQLNEAERTILKRIIHKHMQNGVTFHLPETCLIHENVQIGRDTVIHPGTILEGNTVIGENCEIGPYSRIEDGTVGNGVIFMNSVMTQSEVGNNTKVGPFAYIRPGSKIGQNIKIGDFVEIKNSVIDDGTKVPHLSYVGDSDVGKCVNIGCGVVAVNYDGRKKHRTVIGDHAFIGCNANLVSPVVIKDYAYIAAGSTITEEVPEYALAIARSRQTVIENWVKKKGLDNK
jgi:bifunctional UDP-N-acetylglucosamine pyrophosphorylase/glucosamine-1-phosphate N-acetyltransferase